MATEMATNHANGTSNESNGAKRSHWNKKMQSLLSSIGYTVGLGHIWEFPYLCATNGGAAFLVAYFVIYIIIGIPILFMELAIGQYAQMGSLQMMAHLFPILKGVGYAMIICSFGTAIYYNVMIAWSCNFLFASMQSELPWAGCEHDWNTNRCRTYDIKCQPFNYSLSNISNSPTLISLTYWGLIPSQSSNLTAPTDEFWNALLLIQGLNSLVYLSPMQVVYFFVLFPYLTLVVIIVRGTTLSCSKAGILLYFHAGWEKLGQVDVWSKAATQVLKSLGLGYGCLITIGSHNKFNNNCFRDAMLVSLFNGITSLLAGLAMFSFTGFLAFANNGQVDNTVEGGIRLAFVAYPLMAAQVSLPKLWSILFYLMVMMLGLSTQVMYLENILVVVLDSFPKSVGARKRTSVISLLICCTIYGISLPCTTQAGYHIVNLMANHFTGISILIICLFESIAIGWGYGSIKLGKSVTKMIGYKPWLYYWWIFCWISVVPVFLMALAVYETFRYLLVQANMPISQSRLPSRAMNWALTSYSLLVILLFAICQLMNTNTIKGCYELFKPRKDIYGDLQLNIQSQRGKWHRVPTPTLTYT
ncbi:Sodium-dependent serotonin transporter [Trichoplax sp. H2]|nr:Sodium-dependent serotonin transporter [Trichoplax sp. H2]|eukprot:RDD36653.1 Sodium-dependent serotonin transporter [Trichoplax sp. H2]